MIALFNHSDQDSATLRSDARWSFASDAGYRAQPDGVEGAVALLQSFEKQTGSVVAAPLARSDYGAWVLTSPIDTPPHYCAHGHSGSTTSSMVAHGLEFPHRRIAPAWSRLVYETDESSKVILIYSSVPSGTWHSESVSASGAIHFATVRSLSDPTQAFELSDLTSKIARFSQTDPTVRPETGERAVVLLRMLPKGTPLPQVSASPDGEIGFFWFHNGNRVEAYLDPEEHLTWIGKFDGAFDRGGDIDWDHHMPGGFLEMLHRLYA